MRAEEERIGAAEAVIMGGVPLRLTQKLGIIIKRREETI
jgi:hypothetical protein